MANKSILTMNKKELIANVTKQAKSINRKSAYFRKEDVRTYFDMIDTFLGNTFDKTKKGNLKVDYNALKSLDKDELRYLASSMQQINKSEMYGTQKKYESNTQRGVKWLHETIYDTFVDQKGYDKGYILSLLNDKNFTKELLENFKNAPEYALSEDIIEQTLLNYKTPSKESLSKTLSNIEYRLNQQKQYDNFRNEILRG